MSLREAFPKPRESSPHYCLTLARGERMRTFALRRGVLFAGVSLVPILALACLALTLLFVFRDDLLASLMARQAEMQYAYEDRIAAMRSEIERVTSRELVTQDAFEGRLHALFARQTQLETRAALVASLAEKSGITGDPTGAIPKIAAAKPSEVARPTTAARDETNPLLNATAQAGFATLLPAPAMSFAPLTAALPQAAPKPHPDAMQLRLGAASEPSDIAYPVGPQSALDAAPERPIAEALAPDLAFPTRLTIASSSLDRLEAMQVQSLTRLHAPVVAAAERLRSALAETGLPPSRLIPPEGADKKQPVGGPFVPIELGSDSSPFAREFSKVQEAVLATVRLRAILPRVPLRKPLPGAPEVSSGFGARIDPFLGRAAMHTGIDLRDDYGSPVRSTAAGQVVTAGWTGGYGNMVEIDHGNGIATRYGHLSSIAVHESQTVEPGTVLGRVGSTGRSTGPHLHYEVRIDDEAVDPARFLRAATKLASGD
ncbi:MAG: M23 family metallopeptidase [Beijerinckiaceae bacterium]